MSYASPRGHSLHDWEAADFIKLPSIYTFATLPPARAMNIGVLAYTTDQGICFCAGTSWIILANGGGQASPPTYASNVADSPGTNVNNYSPTLFGPTTSKLQITAAATGTVVTGINATGFVEGQSLIIRNPSTTDQLVFPHLSGSSTAGNTFSNPNAASVGIPPLGASLAVRDSSRWVFV